MEGVMKNEKNRLNPDLFAQKWSIDAEIQLEFC
jgi:hypothetical protein